MVELSLRVRVGEPLREAKKTFKVDVEFRARSVLTERTRAVAEAFGIGVDDEQRFPVFQDFRVNVDPGDVVYVTGESGGGKSVLLHELRRAMEASAEFQPLITDWDLRVDPGEVLVHGVGATVEEALNTLSLAGLNEAFLWLRRYKELSDGQRYRYRVAKMAASQAKTWLFDEFAATLDRETARVVAYSVQKTARRLGRTLVAATTHMDLSEDLGPSVHVHKGFMAESNVRYAPNAPVRECTVAREAFIRPGSKLDYDRLKAFHYRTSGRTLTRRVYALCLGKPENVVGVIVYGPSPYLCGGRTRFMGRVVSHEEVRRDWVIISRVVVHPRYRSVGLGARLVRETLAQACKDLGVRYVEAIAVMARYNPFFAKAGMTEVPYESAYRRTCRAILDSLEPVGFDRSLAASETFNLKVLEALSPENRLKLIRNLSIYRGILRVDARAHRLRLDEWLKYASSNPGYLTRAIRNAAIGAQAKKYYAWTLHNAEPEKDDRLLLVTSSHKI